MTKFSAPINEMRTPPQMKIVVWIGVIVFGVNMCLYLDEIPYRKDFVLAVCILFIVFLIIIKLFEFFSSGKPPIKGFGEITLTDRELIIQLPAEHNIFSYDELISITLEVNETSRDKDFRSDFNGKKSGLGNQIEIRSKSKDYRKYVMYIDSAYEIEQLDEFLNAQNNPKIIVKRRGEVIRSIKESHFRDYPINRFNTFRKD